MNGTVKRIVRDRGFGFIKGQDGNEYFFHRSTVVGQGFDTMTEGEAVSFDVGQGPKGPRAESVRLA